MKGIRTMRERKIGFIGGGNMAEALIRGMLAASFSAERIWVAEPRAERREWLDEHYGFAARAENGEVARACDVLILSIKPQMINTVMPEISEYFDDKKLLISILAGVSTQTLESFLPGAPRVVRVMPNTPALVGEGAAGLCGGRHAREGDLTAAQQLLESVGVARVVTEKEMDAVTGLSGSGPAYVYTLIEALADGAVRQGLARDDALALASQTVLGAARMVLETGEHPAVLRDRVCSPGGTTIAGVAALEEGNFRATLMNAVGQATQRSQELGNN
jgi:pyrroline-5-carboxylate reductase